MINITIRGTIVLGFVCLALGWYQAGFQLVGIGFLGFIPLSLLLVWRKFRPALGLNLALTVLIAAAGVWVGVSLSLALMSLVCALAAWDLDGFSQRLAYASKEDNPQQLTRRHLMQINLVMLAAVSINLATQIIRFPYGFEWALGLAILSFYGIGALYNAIRNSSH